MERILDIGKYLIDNKVIIVITGPTASGKTKISLELSNDLNIEIISADSRQIYKYFNIGTAKPTNEELSIIPHHFINYLEPDKYYSAGIFEKDAEKVIYDIFKRKRIPVVSGGTGLYIKALCEGFFQNEKSDNDFKIRNELQLVLENEGKDILYDKLLEIDPDSAKKYSDKNPRRVIRALEYYYTVGDKFSEAHQIEEKRKDFNVIYFAVKREREELYKLINERVLKMWEDGLEDETRHILDMGYSEELNSFQTVGYKEILSYIKGNISKEEAIYLIQRNTRHYAKRQMTWFRAMKEIIWIETKEELLQKLINTIVSRETLGNE